MKVMTRTDHWVILDEQERWDHTTPGGTTLNVESIHISRPSNRRDVWFSGRRRLLKGGLSIQDPIYKLGTLDDIPGSLWQMLKKAGVA